MKLMIGPGPADVERLAEPAPLEDRRDDAEGGHHGEQEAQRRP